MPKTQLYEDYAYLDSPAPIAASAQRMSVRTPERPAADLLAETHELGRFKRARRAYGFDEVALVPGGVTINPAEVDVSFEMQGLRLEIPFWAASLDGVV